MNKRFNSIRRQGWFAHGIVCSLVLASTGCTGWWPGSQLRQCRDESNRALGRYQLEAQRAERLEVQNRALTQRVGDLEKRLALIYEASEPGRGLSTYAPSVPQVPANLSPTVQPLPSDPAQSAWRAAPKRNF